MYEKSFPNKRFKHTISFLKKHISNSESILDLGVENPFSKIMMEHGYTVENTTGEDLDENLSTINSSNSDVVTAFEIFEHLLSPYTVLKAIKANKLVASVPLKLWFSSAYRSKTDKWDRHYHEFEDWQFDWLLEKNRLENYRLSTMDQPNQKNWYSPYFKMVYPQVLHCLC